jgi:hypothetical protein
VSGPSSGPTPYIAWADFERVADFGSEVLILGVPDADGEVVLLEPERPVPPGGRVF